jgi:hypothetical protein
MFELRAPHAAPPGYAARIREELKPLIGIYPAGYGLVGTDNAPLTVGTGITLVPGRDGVVLDTTSTNTGLTRAYAVTDHPLTLVFGGRCDNSGGPSVYASLATTADKLVRVYNQNGVVSAQHIGATTNAAASTGVVVSDGYFVSGVAVFASPTDVRIYARGNVGYSRGAVTTNVGALGALNKASFGVYDGSAKTLPFDGQIQYAQWLRVALTDTEAWALVDNPWGMFEPRRIWVPVSAGGGATNLVVADALHAHAADNVVLTSEHLLTISDALHGHAADNLVMTSEHLLTVADALHAHAADNVVLTSATALTLADALHAHAADNVVLTSATALTLADALHAHAADNVVLTSEHLLTVADALHAHAADNVALEVAGSTNLVVQDALHDHLADVLALTSAHLLIVADATHGHTVDGLTLTVASVLALQDALHAHAADNLTLDAGNGTNLLLADALHAHTADGVALTVDAWLVVADGLHAHAADNVILTIPGAFREGNPRAWIVNARQRFVQLAARTRVAHLN